ncbi:TetR/AcrR family transcriptional regulator [Ideonella sp. YS5]|uniref:TetR/AcrR family transcriptional regulator n=1 Tax=Ideonella sp. YS5 TaxID=3453714 RepID=UPI003EEC1429
MRVKTAAKREAILEVASQVFQEMGFERASMDEIASRVGGSKVTLYGYFPSKQQLFLEVAEYMGGRQLGPAFEELAAGSEDLHRVLRRFGEKFLAFVSTPETIGTYRMMVSQAGQSDIASRFLELGPKKGEQQLAAFLQAEMEGGRLKSADANIAAAHLMALITAEVHQPLLMGAMQQPTRNQVRQIAERAVAVFLAAYGR